MTRILSNRTEARGATPEPKKKKENPERMKKKEPETKVGN